MENHRKTIGKPARVSWVAVYLGRLSSQSEQPQGQPQGQHWRQRTSSTSLRVVRGGSIKLKIKDLCRFRPFRAEIGPGFGLSAKICSQFQWSNRFLLILERFSGRRCSPLLKVHKYHQPQLSFCCGRVASVLGIGGMAT